MGVSSKIQQQIEGFSEGRTFGYAQLNVERQEFMAAAKALERMRSKGTIRRLSPGLFYKPVQSVFGELLPAEDQILHAYLFDKGKRIAYLTGTALYNQLGLTTQIPATMRIASQQKRIAISIGTIQAKAVKSYVAVTDENYQLLGLLDALKDFNAIPDLDKASAIDILKNNILDLKPEQTRLLIACALAYPPRVRSFLGALLELTMPELDISKLKNSLNPLSVFHFGLNDLIATAGQWKLK